MTGRYLQHNIKQIVDQIIDLAHPSKVILFGSAAKGEITPDSDLDFMVVVPNRKKIDKVIDLLNTGIRNRPMPCDFVVVTPSVLEKHKGVPGFIYDTVLNSGKEVYVS